MTLDKPELLLVAPTGVAAVNIDGTTLKNHTTAFTYKQLEKVFLNSLGVEVQNYSFASEDFLTAESGKRSSGI